MRKPEHQWETRHYRARRLADPGEGWREEARAEAFALEPKGEAPAAAARFSLHRQVIERAAVSADPGLVDAVRAWVAARGGRSIAVVDESGERVAEGGFSVASLGDPPGGTPPRRIVTLCPSNAEMAAALGCFDRVIACEDSSDWPPEVATRERLGPDLGPDLDRIAALTPDLVVASLSVPGMERVVTGLRARGVPQVVLAPRSVDDVLAEIGALGERLGVPEAAASVRERMEAERRALLAGRPAELVPVYLEWWPRPMFSPAAECYSNELVALAGGRNVFAGRPGSSVEVTAAEVVAAAPAVCFVSWCGVAAEKLDPENLIRRPGLEGLAAAKAGRVYALDEAFAGRPGPRMLEAARIMAAAIRAVAPAMAGPTPAD